MNIVATQISVEEGVKKAWQYALGVAIMEIFYLRLALSGINWVVEHAMLFKIITWLTVVFFFAIGIATLLSTRKQTADKKGVLVDNKISRFVLGISLSAINPMQIPFWFTWTIALLNNGLLLPGYGNYNWFTIGAGIGTISGICLYIYGGKWALKKMGGTNRTLNYILGVVFIIAALVQLYRNLNAPWGKT